jgi:hypothetical protein
VHIVAFALTPDVSITLVRVEHGWRFGHWERPTSDAIALHPSHEHAAQCFPTPEDAAAFFRAHYGARLSPWQR